jgi:hypothetical protein
LVADLGVVVTSGHQSTALRHLGTCFGWSKVTRDMAPQAQG